MQALYFICALAISICFTLSSYLLSKPFKVRLRNIHVAVVSFLAAAFATLFNQLAPIELHTVGFAAGDHKPNHIAEIL
jgi:hypothetical protein